MTEHFSYHMFYAVSYFVIGEGHTEFYPDFAQANQAFETYQRELVGQDYHQCNIDDLVLYRAQVEIPKTISFLNENNLLSYVSSPTFSGHVTKTKLNFLYQQSCAEYAH